MSQVPGATPSPEATPPSAPATTPPATPPAGEEEVVTMPKSKAEQLERDAARAASAQHDLEVEKRKNSGGARKVLTPEPFSDTDKAEVHREITARLLSDERMQQAISKNPLLKRTLTGPNPLSLLGQGEFIDARDAVDQLFAFVEDEVLSKDGGATPPPATPPAPSPVATPAPPSPSTPGHPPVTTEEEARQKELNKLSGMDKATASILGRVRYAPKP